MTTAPADGTPQVPCVLSVASVEVTVDAAWLLTHAEDEFLRSLLRRGFRIDTDAFDPPLLGWVRNVLAAWGAADPAVGGRMTGAPRRVIVLVDAAAAVRWLSTHRYGLLVELLTFVADWRPIHGLPGNGHPADSRWRDNLHRGDDGDWTWAMDRLGIDRKAVHGNTTLVTALQRLHADVLGIADAAVRLHPHWNPNWAHTAGRYLYPGPSAAGPVMTAERALAYAAAGLSAAEAVARETGTTSRPADAALSTLAGLRGRRAFPEETTAR